MARKWDEKRGGEGEKAGPQRICSNYVGGGGNGRRQRIFLASLVDEEGEKRGGRENGFGPEHLIGHSLGNSAGKSWGKVPSIVPMGGKGRGEKEGGKKGRANVCRATSIRNSAATLAL